MLASRSDLEGATPAAPVPDMRRRALKLLSDGGECDDSPPVRREREEREAASLRGWWGSVKGFSSEGDNAHTHVPLACL